MAIQGLDGVLARRAAGNRALIRHAPTRDIALGLDFRARLLDIAAEAARYNDVTRATALAAAAQGDRYALPDAILVRALGITPATFQGGGLGGLDALGWPKFIDKAAGWVGDKVGQAANWVSDKAGDVVKTVVDNPLHAVLSPVTLMLKPMANTLVDIAGSIPVLGKVMEPVMSLAVKPLTLTTDITSWGVDTIQRETVNSFEAIGKIAKDPWGELQRLPGAMYRFNPLTLSINAAAQITEVTGESMGIKELERAGSFVDRNVTDAGKWLQEHPVETIVGSLAVVAAGAGIGAAVGAPGILASVAGGVGSAIGGAAGAAAGLVGGAAGLIGPALDFMGGGGGGPMDLGPPAPPAPPQVVPAYPPPPPGPIDTLMATIAGLPTAAKVGGVVLVGAAVYMLVTPPAPPMRAPRLAGYEPAPRRPTQRKRRRRTAKKGARR